MPSYRIITMRAPTMRKAYGGNVQSNAASFAPTALAPPLGQFGGAEAVYGNPPGPASPTRLTLGGDPQMANYLPSEQIPSRWAPPVIYNGRYTVLTTPPQSPLLKRVNRDIHVPMPASQRPTSTSAVISNYYQGGGNAGGPGRARAPRGIATPTPTARPRFRLFGGGTT